MVAGTLPIIHLQRRGNMYHVYNLHTHSSDSSSCPCLTSSEDKMSQMSRTRCRWISSRVRCAWDAQLIQLFYGVKMFNCYLLALSVIGSDSLSWCCHILGQWEARIPGHVITLNPSGRDVLNAFFTVTMVLVTSAFNLGSVWVATCITGTPSDQIVYA